MKWKHQQIQMIIVQLASPRPSTQSAIFHVIVYPSVVGLHMTDFLLQNKARMFIISLEEAESLLKSHACREATILAELGGDALGDVLLKWNRLGGEGA